LAGIAFSIPSLLLAATALASLQGCNYEAVDGAPAIAVGDKFYGALKHRDGNAALSFFSPAFRSSEKEKSGAVASAELRGASLVARDDSPCYFLDYAIKRESLATDEGLLVCRAAGGTNWEIAGHVLTRLDSKQSIWGGVVPTGIGTAAR
jgi:hypothetical protein